jgi:UDP-4-amino-4,6-dideoxy-N-acetyl-beta-L-altrosamine N-acetyltransferase
MGLRIAKESDLEKMLEWRNQEANRNVMFTSHQISAHEHLSWWEKCSADKTRLVLIFACQGVECGVVTFFNIDACSKSAHWGFYLDKVELDKRNLTIQAWAKLESEALEYAHGVLNLSKLTCQTLEKNRAVLIMHERFGFIQKRTFDYLCSGEPKLTIEMEISFTHDDWSSGK